MKHILIIGAGRSTPYLIKYLLDQSSTHTWRVTVGDVIIDNAIQKLNNHPNGNAIEFDVHNDEQMDKEIGKVDIVVSMLPARFHIHVVKACVRLKKNLITASYVSDEIKEFDEDAKKAGIILLNEIGVDPGLDHMSAMQIIDKIRARGGKPRSFETFTGGLVAPESDNNPWHYKFTWNPRNVVLAGQGVVKFIQEGRYKYIPYHNIFKRTEKLSVLDYGEFEGYANRDSLQYREIYDLHDIPTMFRGTLRRPGFCRAWDLLVQLGATDDSYTIEDSKNMTYREFINSFLLYRPDDSIELKLAYYLGIDIESPEMEKLKWLGVFNDTRIGLKNATPAQILQHLLKDKWELGPKDKDMIVMLHKIKYKSIDTYRFITSSLVVIGEKEPYTAMAKTVGLPLGIAAKLILNGNVKARGIQLPIIKEIYEPALKELQEFGINFIEGEIILT
ncbi:MAG: saccharopine dehydrogenase C-terminal domain-containing protein [Bacteroidota bacterium]